MRRAVWSLARPLGGAGILAVLLWRLGTGPFLAGVRLIDGWALAAAVAIGVPTTVAAAWRWSLVAGGLGMRLPVPSAVARCYGAVFLNATLPGGVLGDVHRAVHHGRGTGDVGRGVRAVVWERAAGQVVQVAVALAVLAAFPSPVRAYLPAVAAVLAGALAAGLVAALLAAALLRAGRAGAAVRAGRAGAAGRAGRAEAAGRAAWRDVRDGVLARRALPGVLAASVLAVAGHLATFLVAARTAGATQPLTRLVPLTLLALLAMGLPLNVGGFGPREGVAAWAFGAAGLSAAQGVATATVYGVLVLVASLPGAVVMVAWRVRTARAGSRPRTARAGSRPRATVHDAQQGDDVCEAPPVATIRTQVTIPLRFPDGYATDARVFSFHGLVDGREHLAIGLGAWAGAQPPPAGAAPPLVRPHSECLTGDVLGSQRCDCGPQLREAVERIATVGGLLLYLRQEGRGIGLYAKLDAYALQDAGLDTYQANLELGFGADERDYTAAAQMLTALGVRRIALLSNNPDKADQLHRLGVAVADRVPTGVHLSAANGGYLAAKASLGAHTLHLPLAG